MNSKGVFLNGVGSVKLDLFSRLTKDKKLLKIKRIIAKTSCDLKMKKMKNGIDEAMFSINLNFIKSFLMKQIFKKVVRLTSLNRWVRISDIAK